MSTRLQILCLGLGLLLSSLGASAQSTRLPELAEPLVTTPEPLAAAVLQRAQQKTVYLADALQLKVGQAAALQTALQVRLDAVEVLSHLLFASAPVATAAFDAIDYRYYTAMGKVLTPTQFHKLLQLDEQAAGESEAPMVLRSR
jgi:hypothetical protein